MSLKSAVRVSAAVIILFTLSIAAASAQRVCGSRHDLIRQLQDQFGERPAGHGVLADGRLVELVVSSDGGWSLLVTRPDGTTCLVAAGVDWQRIESKTSAPPA